MIDEIKELGEKQNQLYNLMKEIHIGTRSKEDVLSDMKEKINEIFGYKQIILNQFEKLKEFYSEKTLFASSFNDLDACVRFAQIQVDGKNTFPVAVTKGKVLPGSTVINNDGVLYECNQSTCINFDEKVIGSINPVLPVSEGEKITLVYDCKAEENCSYPFCGNKCPGSKESFRVAEYEKRPY